MLSCLSVRSSELISAIRAAKSADNDAKAAKILGGALKQLRLSRLKPDLTLNSALVTLVLDFPDMFSTLSVMEALVLVLKREPSVIFKARSNPAVYILAAQLLLFALRESYDWPEMVAKVSLYPVESIVCLLMGTNVHIAMTMDRLGDPAWSSIL